MEAKIKDNGGLVRGGVWRKTNYLLVGEQNRAVVKDKENKSPQEIKAEELIAGGSKKANSIKRRLLI